jgi:mannose-6-phosphate isomerase-like protein (cupin superfamily)
MGYTVCDSDELEPLHGVLRPIRRILGVSAFGINQEDWPANSQDYPEHDEATTGHEEVYYVLGGSGRIEVDGEQIDLKPGRYVFVEPGTKRKMWPGPDGLSLLCVGSPAGKGYEPRQA